MSDLERYVKKRKRLDPEFAEGFDVGYSNFKVGVLLRQAREKAGMTQDDVARRLRTKKSAISRIENHAEDIRLSTIQKYAKALGKNLRVEIRGCHTIEGQACNMQFQGRCELHIACLTPDQRPKVYLVCPRLFSIAWASALFAAQRDHRIDAGGSTRRYKTGGQRNKDQQQGNSCEDHRIGRADFE